MSKPQLMVYDQACPLCQGWGKWSEWIVEYLHTRTCTSCDGTGKVPRPYGWRPYEPEKTNLLDEMLASLSEKPDAVAEVELTQEFVGALLDGDS